MWPARGFSNGSHVSQVEMIPELRLLQGHVQEKLEPTVINQACNHQSVRNILGRKGEELEEEEEGEVSTLFKHESLATFVEARRLNRLVQQKLRELKAQAWEIRQTLDQRCLTLLNLQYEKVWLGKQISECKQVETIYHTVPLPEEAVFLENAPLELQQKGDSWHERYLNRLRFELAERERLNQEIVKLNHQRNRLNARKKQRKDELAKLDHVMMTYFKQASSVKKFLQIDDATLGFTAASGEDDVIMRTSSPARSAAGRQA